MTLGSRSFSNLFAGNAKGYPDAANCRVIGWKQVVVGAMLCVPAAAMAVDNVRVNANSNPVQVYVNAWTTDNKPITGLDSSTIRLFEDGNEQSVEAVLTPEDNAVSVLFLMDYSPSIRTVDPSPRLTIETAVKTVLDKLDVNDRAAVVKFGLKTSTGYEAFDFTSDYDALKLAVDKNPSNSGNTRLYDAIDDAIDMFGQANITGNSRSIILLSDGYDTNSQTTWSQLRDKLQTAGVSVFTIAYGPQVDEGRQAMQDIAALSGGIFHEAQGMDNENLGSLYTEVADSLTNEYIVTYNSSASFTDCSPHTLKVDIDAPNAIDYTTAFQRCIEVEPSNPGQPDKKPLVADAASSGGGGAQGLGEALALTLLGMWMRRRSAR